MLHVAGSQKQAVITLIEKRQDYLFLEISDQFKY